MSQIGQFTRDKSGFAGRIHTLFISTTNSSSFRPRPSDAENAPDYRVHIDDDDGPEIGAGWKRIGERAGEYIALVIDDPTLPQPIRANLFRDDDKSAWSLHWSRPPKRGEQD